MMKVRLCMIVFKNYSRIGACAYAYIQPTTLRVVHQAIWEKATLRSNRRMAFDVLIINGSDQLFETLR